MEDPSVMEITVNPCDGGMYGTHGRDIQRAIDALSSQGGGTVSLMEGSYVLDGPLRLRSHVRVVGAGREKTLIRRVEARSCKLAVDADIGEKEFTPAQPELFSPGSGVAFRDGTGPGEKMIVMPLVITEIGDGVCLLDDYIAHDYSAVQGAVVVNYFPLIHGFGIEGAGVEGLTLDGKVNDDPGWAGITGGNLYLRRCRDCLIQGIRSIHANGDGVRYGQCSRIMTRECEVAFNSNYGIHAGSHSRENAAIRCDVHHNGSDGVYICWGVRESRFADNVIHHNGEKIFRTGISIGHKDTDNIIENNHIYENACHGLHFRVETEANGAHRNMVRRNVIEDNGAPEALIPEWLRGKVPSHTLRGCGIFVSGITRDLCFEDNIVRETRSGGAATQRNGVWLEPGTSRITLKNNQVSGHPEKDVVDNGAGRAIA